MEQAQAALDVLEDDPQYAVEREQQITNTPEVERIRQYAAAGQLDKWAEDDAKAIVEKYASENPGYLWEEWAQQHPIDAETVASGGNFFGGLFGSRYKGVPIEEIYADYAEMSEAEKQTAREISLLSEKASNAAALGYGAADAIPFYATLADMAARGTQEALGMDGGVLPSERMEATQQQSPIAYTGGNLAGSMALYGGLSAAASGIPALQNAGAAIASTRPAQAVSNIPVLGRLASQQAITGALADVLPDTLDNAEVVWQGYHQNAQQADILANPTAYGYADEAEARAALMEANGGQLRTGTTPWLEGAGNAALNIGANAAFELVPELVRTGRNALRNGQYQRELADLAQPGAAIPDLGDTQSADNVFRAADDAAQRTAAETAQKPIDDIVTAWRNGTLTNAQMETLKPGGSNRAAFEAVTGTTLPGTSGETRRFLRQHNSRGSVGTPQNISRFADEVDNAFKGNSRYDSPIILGDTPQLYKELGAQPLNITIEPRTLYKIAYPDGYMQGKHNLGIPALKQLPYQIENPVAILKSNTQPNSFVILTEWADINGNPVIIPLHLNKQGVVSLENRVTSAYGKGNINAILGENGKNILWTRGNEGIDQLLSRRLQLPKAVVDDTLVSNYNIPDTSDNVNPLPTPDLLRADATSAPIPTPDDLRTTNPLPTVGGIGETMDGTLPESIGAMRHDAASYSALQNEYGTIAPGENPARVVDVPISTNGQDRVGAGVRTIMEAENTPDEMVELLEQGVKDGIFSHDVVKDKAVLERAANSVAQEGYDNILAAWRNTMRTGASVNKEQIAQGQLLYTLAAKNGDWETANKIAGDLVRIATEAGQNLQAQRLLKRMTPEGKLYYARQTVESFNRQLREELGDEFQDIVIPDDLAQAVMDAKNAKEQGQAMDSIYQFVADQLPSDWGTRWNAWRYLSMLSNPATHVRNVLSNAANIPARKLKNLIGAGIESTAARFGLLDPEQRTKAFLGFSKQDQALKDFARKDLDNVMADLGGARKYSEQSEIRRRIDPFKINGQWGKRETSGAVARGARRVADTATGGLSWLYRTNSNALSAEDMLFKRGAYVDSLAGFLKARNIDPAKATAKQLDEARAYAVEEALRATYTEANALSDALSRFERTSPYTKVFIGGTVPFKRTPMNIIRRAVRYSPAGLVGSVFGGAYNLRHGNITASQFIDNISQGLSGTGIFALGMWLNSMGLINGVGSDNKNERNYKTNARGTQEYSLNFPWGTYTIDWAGPSAVALLAGAEFHNMAERDGFGDLNALLSSLGTITEPVFDTTMLSGINDALKAASYGGTNMVTAAAGQAISNFISQGVPSVAGVVARAADPTRRSVYSDREGIYGSFDEAAQRLANRLPVLSENQEPYIDVWGRTQENQGGNFVGRLAYGMLSPGYYQPNRTTDADRAVDEIYADTQDTGVFPSAFGDDFTEGGVSYTLNPRQYTVAKQTKGQTANELMGAFYNSELYDAIPAITKADVASEIYTLSTDLAKLEAVPSLMDAYETRLEEGDASSGDQRLELYLEGGVDGVLPVLIARAAVKDVSGDKDRDGNTIRGSVKQNKIDALVELGFSRQEAESLYDIL